MNRDGVAVTHLSGRGTTGVRATEEEATESRRANEGTQRPANSRYLVMKEHSVEAEGEQELERAEAAENRKAEEDKVRE